MSSTLTVFKQCSLILYFLTTKFNFSVTIFSSDNDNMSEILGNVTVMII